jgi:membrane associated rhomboid family serine protease
MAINLGGGQGIPPLVKNLLIINVLVFLAQIAFEQTFPVYDTFALHHYRSEVFEPYQLVTHMFMHGGVWHLIFNMFALFMFGSTLERIWTPKFFLIFYLACGLGAAVTQMGSYAVENWERDHKIMTEMEWLDYQGYLRQAFTVGASGAIMGLLVAFGYLFPNTQLIIFPIPVPIKAKWAIAGLVAIDLFGGFARVPGDQIAHFAHLGGALTGILIMIFRRKTNRRTFY